MGYRLASPTRKKGIDAQSIRMLGWVILAIGIVAMTIIQNRLLGFDLKASGDLSERLKTNKEMTYASIALVCYCVESCAIPIFAFLLVEGVKHTKRLALYFARVAGVAALSVIPYNLVCHGKPFVFTMQNPVIGLLVAMVMLYFFRQYGAKTFKGIAISVLVVIISLMWVKMLNVQDGTVMILMVTVLWLTRKKLSWQVYGGAVAMVVCSVLSTYYTVGAFAFILLHFYNGEQGDGKRIVNYLAYPALLLGIWAFGRFVM